MHMCVRVLLAFVFSFYLLIAFGQNPDKLKMDYTTYDIWNQLKDWQISNDGHNVVYEYGPESKNTTLKIYNTVQRSTTTFERASNATFSFNKNFLIFTISPDVDSLRAMRRNKIEESKLPKDTLVIYNLWSREVEMITDVASNIISEKWGDWLAYKTKAYKTAVVATDTIGNDSTNVESSKEVQHYLYVRQLSTGFLDSIPEPEQFHFAKKGASLVVQSNGVEDDFKQGIYIYDCLNKKLDPVFKRKGAYKKLSIDDSGTQVSFVVDIDTNYNQIKPYNLFYWRKGMKEVTRLAHPDSKFMPRDWKVNEHRNLQFSEDGSKLYFGISPPPILQDTLLLPDEIVQVEVWSHDDYKLYPQQKIDYDSDKKRSYLSVYHTKENKIKVIADELVPNVSFERSKNANVIPATSYQPYQKEMSWEGYPMSRDLYAVDLITGKRELIQKKLRGDQRLSPDGKYIVWFNHEDASWYSYDISKKRKSKIGDGKTNKWADEINDRPMLPYSYGFAGWTENDKNILLYDRYDIWQVDPRGKDKPKRLTKGREAKIKYRFIDLDKEAHFIDSKKPILLLTFNENDKSSGYASLELGSKKMKTFADGDFSYSRNIEKSNHSHLLVFTKENFQEFPDLYLTSTSFKNIEKISDINPQQADYSWGTIELVKWKSKDGEVMEGMLVKPEGFDKNKQYPMIVNFYEKSSNALHRHRAPYPHRSTINYSFYANQGYLIFNPNVHYKIGYPGQSALDAVMSGVQHIKEMGFVDEDNIGLQGHSWGGYQVAHIITKTNDFKCAESGAPVVNMTSAYGGIRWRTGLSRMFQYEHTQSRIGGTLWEKPDLYLENSPLFNVDKIETPVLILHNDKDGAVPWYQGIEFFVALRRLNKKAWMLNYNNEPHWPLKRQNRIDFNRRMLQFFDHYLKGEALPKWMRDGVPAIEKGILQGLDNR